MRTLLIARHAKSDWSAPELADHERPLNARGRRDAPRVAHALAGRGRTPDHVFSSTSARTRETWALMAPCFDARPPVEWLPELYLASPRTVLDVAASAPAGAATVMVLGHNPGVHEAAARLSARGAAEALERIGAHMPTGAVAVVELDGSSWKGAAGDGTLADLILPKELR